MPLSGLPGGRARVRPLAALALLVACGAPPPPQAPLAQDAIVTSTARASAATPAEPAEAPGEESAGVPISRRDAAWGARRAYVTIVAFTDFQCPFCARAAVTLAALQEKYGPHELRVVWKHNPLPFHPQAMPAAEAAQGVYELGGPEAFARFHDAAFGEGGRVDDTSVERWIGRAGVTPSAVREGMSARRWRAKIEDDMALAARLDARGTPTFFVNGHRLTGAQPRERFVELIDAEMARARAREQTGTPREALYAALSSEARAAEPAAPKDDDDDRPAPDDRTVFKVPVAGSPSQGDARALVTIVEFSDFQCPFCKRARETVKRVQTTYGDKVRLVWKNQPLPFHPRAAPAANLAMEARAQKGEKAFWTVHDELFASNGLEDADFERIARFAGLDVPRAMTAVSGARHKGAIDRDVELADDVMANGTPHFFVNGRRLAGAQPFEKFQAVIDEEVAHAQTLLGQGVPREKLYDALMKDAKSGAEPETLAARVEPPANAPSRGAASAPVTVQVFSDYQCPFCARGEKTLDEVKRAYGAKVRFVWRDLALPFHKDAQPAAEAARAAMAQRGPDAYWKMHDRLYADQRMLSRDALERHAKELGLDVAAFQTALDQGTHRAAVDADAAAAKAAGITGTPTFIVAGKYVLRGAQPLPKFKKVIDRALKEAGTRTAR